MSANQSNTVQLAKHKVASAAFDRIYDKGMDLVEETASYLDGAGREESKNIHGVAASLYAAESMRLTTRLMQLASWLLLQRALNRGEMDDQQVQVERAKIRLDTVSANDQTDGWAELPESFKSLVDRSIALQKQVKHLDNELFGFASSDNTTQMANPVTTQLNLLKTAFGG